MARTLSEIVDATIVSRYSLQYTELLRNCFDSLSGKADDSNEKSQPPLGPWCNSTLEEFKKSSKLV